MKYIGNDKYEFLSGLVLDKEQLDNIMLEIKEYENKNEEIIFMEDEIDKRINSYIRNIKIELVAEMENIFNELENMPYIENIVKYKNKLLDYIEYKI